MQLHKRLDQIERSIPPANGLDSAWYEVIRTPVDQILETMDAGHRATVRREIAAMLTTALPYPQMSGPEERIYVAGGVIGPLPWAILDMARAHVEGRYAGALRFPAVLSRHYLEVVTPAWKPWPPMLDPWNVCPAADCGFQWMPADFRRDAVTCPACDEPLPPRMTGWDWRMFAKDMELRARVCEQAVERLGVERAIAWLEQHGWEVSRDAA